MHSQQEVKRREWCTNGLSYSIVQTIAELEETTVAAIMDELEPIGDTVDVEAMERLLQSEHAHSCVSLELDDYHVEIRQKTVTVKRL